MRAGVALLAASLVLTGCGGASRVRLVGMSDSRPADYAPDPTIAVCPRMMTQAPIAPDTLAFLVGEFLRDEYGRVVHTDALATDLCDCFQAKWLNAASYQDECVGEAPEIRSASRKGAADILLFGLFPYSGHGGFLVRGVDSRSGQGVVAAAAEGKIRSCTMDEEGELVVTPGVPLKEFAQVLAEALDWQLDHPGQEHPSLKRLEKGQPWSKVLTSEDKRRLLGGR